MYSSTIRVDLSGSPATGLTIYPNPAHGSLNFVLGGSTAGQGLLQVADMSGRIILNRSIQLSAGSNTLSLEIGDLTPGSYILRVAPASGKVSVAPFLVVQ